MRLVALACPDCGTSLDVAAEARVLPCHGCRHSFALASDAGRLVRVPRTLVRPRQVADARAAIVLLPVWSVSVDTGALGGVGAALPEVVRLPAVGVARMPLLMQFARNLTRAPAVVEEWSGGPEVVPERAEIPVEDAFTLAETVVLRHLEHWPPDEVLSTLEIPLGSARLLDWPCAVLGGELIELVAGLSIHRSLVEQVPMEDRRAALAPAMEAIAPPPGA